MEDSAWLLVVTLGPIIIAIVAAYALITRRRLGPAEKRDQAAATEAGFRNEHADKDA